jgi:hypothetical protein
LCSLRDGMHSTVWLLPILHNTWIGGRRKHGPARDVLRISERDGPHTTPGTGSPENAASAFAVDIVDFRRW